MFEAYGVDKWVTDDFTITRVKGYSKNTIDSKRLKADNEEIYKKYVKETKVKPTVKIELK